MHEGERTRTGDVMVAAGAVSALLAVAAGAFGAHLLEARVTDAALRTFETAARYQMYHALALLFAGRFLVRRPSRMLLASCWMFLLGTVLFSGSLYGLALSEEHWLGGVTPAGGLCFLLGWLCLGLGALRRGLSTPAAESRRM
jgi:uncharacterized membrane protein YgdD (TMEM256/DUF423 family)